MITLQYFNGTEWIFISEWYNEALAWACLGTDNRNYRTMDAQGKVLTDMSINYQKP